MSPEESSAEPIDRGTLAIYVGEEKVGKEHVEIVKSKDGETLHAVLELTMDEDRFTASSVLNLDRSWRPLSARAEVETSDGQKISIDLSQQSGRLRETTTVGDLPPKTVTAPEKVDLYLGEAALSFAAPLCRPVWNDKERIAVFPDLSLPFERTEWAMVPSETEGGAPTPITLVLVDPESNDPLVTLCEGNKLALIWLPSIHMAAGREGYESIAEELAAGVEEEPENGDTDRPRPQTRSHRLP